MGNGSSDAAVKRWYRKRCVVCRNAWLNPEPRRVWNSPTIEAIGQVFPMYPLTLEGLDEMVKTIVRPPASGRRRLVHELLREAR